MWPNHDGGSAATPRYHNQVVDWLAKVRAHPALLVALVLEGPDAEPTYPYMAHVRTLHAHTYVCHDVLNAKYAQCITACGITSQCELLHVGTVAKGHAAWA